MRPSSLAPLALSLAVTALAPASAWADEVADQANRLAALRAEVEALADQLDEQKEDARNRLKSVEAQQVDLEVQVRRQELRIERLVAEEEAQRATLAAAGEGDGGLRPVVEDGLGQMRSSIQAGLPFKQEDRLKAVDDLSSRLADGSLTVEQVAARLWALAEDERRLGRENALDRQVIALDGDEVLVEVARVGRLGLYFRAPDGSVGQARASSAGWTWQRLNEPAQQEQVAALFDGLTRGIRVGVYELPALVSEVRR